MQVPTANQIKSELRAKASEFINAREEYLKATHILSSLGAQGHTDKVWVVDFGAVIQNYFKTLISQLNEVHSGGTSATIGLPVHLYELGVIRGELLAAEKINKDDQIALLYKSIDTISIEEIVNYLKEESANLESAGTKKDVGELARQLGFGRRHGKPKRKGWFLSCEVNKYESHYHRIRHLLSMSTSLRKCGEATSIDFGAGIDEITARIDALDILQEIPSREVFGQGCNVEVHNFNGHHTFKFTPQATEALFAYFSLYCDDDVLDDIALLNGDKKTAA